MKFFLFLPPISLLFSQISALTSTAKEIHVRANAQDCPEPDTCADPQTAIPFLRAYLPGQDHFYTTDAAEMQNAVQNLGYQAEGTAANVFGTQVNFTVPLYRLYNGARIDHFYTTSVEERDNAIANLGYSDEGTAAYVYATPVCDSIPFYRLYNPSIVDHFYTTSAAEVTSAVRSSGYDYELIAAYVLPAA